MQKINDNEDNIVVKKDDTQISSELNFVGSKDFTADISDIEKSKYITSDKQSYKDVEFIEKEKNNITKSKAVVEYINSSNSNNNTEDNNVFENVEYSDHIENVKITKTEKEFLNKFKAYDLVKLELHTRLFDLTGEYPDDYIEYYSDYLSLYFFGNKPYSKLKDIFNVLSYELPFKVAEVNNFGLKSFYINLDEEFNDDFIRVVILYKNRTVGVKIKRNVYDDIKSKFKNLDI